PFHVTAPSTTDIHTLSLHDALPISSGNHAETAGPPQQPDQSTMDRRRRPIPACRLRGIGRSAGTLWLEMVEEAKHRPAASADGTDRKSTRLNSSHVKISYAVFCLKK